MKKTSFAFPLASVIIFSLFFVTGAPGFLGPFHARTAAASVEPAASSAPPAAAVDETPQELEKIINSILSAIKLSDKPGAVKKIADFRIAEPKKWFAASFGDEKGAAIASAYEAQMNGFEEQIYSIFEKAVKDKKTEITVIKIEKAGDPNATGLQKTALETMKEPRALYTVKLCKKGEEFGTKLWSFVYIDGNFRLAGKMEAKK